MIKMCTKCKVEQSIDCFSKNKREKDGLRSNCKSCDKQYHMKNKESILIKKKQYYEENKDKKAQYDKHYFTNNKEVIACKKKQHYEEHKESILIKKKQYYEENKESVILQKKQYHRTPMGNTVKRNSEHKRRSLTRQGDVTSTQLLKLIQSTTHCFWCNIPLKAIKPHIDHITPLSMGGPHTVSNLRVLCPTCNKSKGSKDILEFAKIIFNKEIK